MKVMVIHGTFEQHPVLKLLRRGRRWFRSESRFCRALADEIGPTTFEDFAWTGLNRHYARERGGEELAAVIRRISGASPAEPIHLIAHSHGGNVALAAVNALPEKTIASLTLLGTPHFEIAGAPEPWIYFGDAARRVATIWNLYSPRDGVQKELAGCFHFMGASGRGRRIVSHREYAGPGHESVKNGAIDFRGFPTFVRSHNALHSAVMGRLIGRLIARPETPFDEALAHAGLAAVNRIADNGY